MRLSESDFEQRRPPSGDFLDLHMFQKRRQDAGATGQRATRLLLGMAAKFGNFL